jgi:hypothetical protein
MTRPILVLRVARRAIAAAVIDEEKFVLLDGRHLSSLKESMAATVRRYLNELLEKHEPTGVLILAPEERYDARGILRDVQTVLAQAGRSMRIIRVPELLKAFGAPALTTREQLWETAQGILPELLEVRSTVKPYIVDAAALALYSVALLGLLSPG